MGAQDRRAEPRGAVTFSPVSFLCGVVLGSGLGMIALARWWIWHTNKPEIGRAMLQSLYQTAHPHWLQVSRDDSTPVCPCCGWHPKAVKTPPQKGSPLS